MIFSALFFGSSRLEQLAMLAARHRVPATYQFREFVSADGLISYGTTVVDSLWTRTVRSAFPLAEFSKARSRRS
jgi:hypothetical protein